uniref:Uncharacterized protein n=1 Tax=Rhizophora mucronata TaxID=61149 RepID=A0A2P2P6F1_RHIMU
MLYQLVKCFAKILGISWHCSFWAWHIHMETVFPILLISL